jgi:hypothetical protein
MQRDDGTDWVGNFQPGVGGCCTAVIHPDKLRLLVISKGQVYVVDPNDPSKWEQFASDIVSAIEVPELEAILLCNGLWFELMGAKGTTWQSRRISWDGISDIKITGLELVGRAWSPEERWYDFTLDILDGTVTGGSFNGPGSPDYST